MSPAKDTFPFSAVVGQEQAQLALLLAAIDPGIGGVLLRGDKGSAKSTLARGLAGLLPDGAAFVELPVGATEDRVLGSLDLRAALTDGADRFRPGLLAAAHGGVLYVDEVNLLPDHLVDGLLDAAASGVNRVERDGVSHEHPARFVLLGSMNPEEGELRPQLLDRFGLSVEVRVPQNPALRAEAVRRRLAHDAGRPAPTPAPGAAGHDPHRQQPAGAPPGAAPEAGGDDPHRRQRPGTPPAATPEPAGHEALRQQLSGAPRSAAPGAGGNDPLRRQPAGAPRSAAPEAGGGDADRRELAGAPLGVAPGAGGDEDLRRRLVAARPADLPDAVVAFAARLAVEVGAESLRADLVLCRAAAALAGWEGRPAATEDDVARVAPLALAHRRRRRPFEPPTLPPDDLRSALDRASSSDDPPAASNGSGDGPGDGGDEQTGRWQDLAGDTLSTSPEPLAAGADVRRRQTSASSSGPGRMAGSRVPAVPDAPLGLAVLPTVRAALQRRVAEPAGPVLEADDLREPVRVRKQGRTVVLAVDASGSMGTKARVEAATGAVLGLLADAYLRRDQVSLIAFRGDQATEALPPTGSVELARARLADLPTGGATPLAAGIEAALRTAHRAAAQGSLPLLVLLTDGRATGAPEALERARQAARAVATSGVEAVVLDAEDGPARLDLAAELAQLMGARHLTLSELTPATVEAAIRDLHPNPQA